MLLRMRGLFKFRQQTCFLFSLKELRKTTRAMSSYNYFDSHGLLPKDGFSFQVGAPNPTSLKQIAALMETSTAQMKTEEGFEQSSLQYGCDVGYSGVREQVANFLTRGYGNPVDKDDIYMTCGASAGLQLLLTHFFTNNHTMFVEDPSYLLVPAFLKNGFFMKGDSAPLENDGINIEVLEEKINKLPDVPVSARHPFKAAVYVIPCYHNPAGISYTPEKCKQLVELARKHNLLVISDDIYNLLTYKTNSSGNFEYSPKRLFTYDVKSDSNYQGNVVSNGTFSKIAAPGLRVGWMEAPKRVIDHLNTGYIPVSGGGMSYYVARVFSGVLKSGQLDQHINGLQHKHKERMAAFITTIEKNLGKYGVTITHPDGGYFLWVKLPENVTGDQVLEVAKKTQNITFVPGVKTSFEGNFKNYIRLSLAYYEADEIKVGAERFCQAVEQVIQSCN